MNVTALPTIEYADGRAARVYIHEDGVVTLELLADLGRTRINFTFRTRAEAAALAAALGEAGNKKGE